MDLKASLKILNTCKGDIRSMDLLVAAAARVERSWTLKLPEERYLLVAGCCSEGKKMNEYVVQFYGYLFDNIGYLVERCVSQVVFSFGVH
jgi:hypothetical protein